MPFTGTYSHAIDAKQRVAIPSEIRVQLRQRLAREGRETDPAYWYAALGEGDYLSLYTEPDFEKLADELDHSERDADEILPYENVYFSLARRVEMDKNGRVRLPEHLLELAHLGSEVEIIGAKDHLEIHDRSAWQAHVSKLLSEQRRLVMNPRRALRRRRDESSD